MLGMSPRVLVLYASQTAEVLTKLGLKVTEASSFEDAQHLLSHEEQFDAVVISDQLIGCAPEERKALYTAATLTTPAVLLGTCFAGPVSALLPDNPLAQYPIVGVEPGVSYGQLLTILSVTAPRTDPVLLAETVRPGPLAEFQMVPSEQPVIGYKRVYLLRENSQWLVAGGFSGAVVPMRTAALCWCAEEGSQLLGNEVTVSNTREQHTPTQHHR